MTEKFIPQVGQVCEFLCDNGKWYLVEIIAKYNGSYVFAAGDDYPYGCYDGCSVVENFRPIQPVSEKYREEQVKYLAKSIARVSGQWSNYISLAEKMFDNGVKVVDKSKGEFVAKRPRMVDLQEAFNRWTHDNDFSEKEFIDAVERAMNVESYDAD